MGMITRWLVTNVGGLHMTGEPQPMWCRTQEEADAEVKRRLKVSRLHHARLVDYRHTERTKTVTHEGRLWTCWIEKDYRAVVESHSDFDRSGGVTASVMVRPDDPLENPF